MAASLGQGVAASGEQGMASHGRGAACRKMHKGKVCVFLLLVVVGILCVGLILYMLFYASPRTSPAIHNGGHSSWRQVVPSPFGPGPTDAAVHS
jgi:hypothetical protein